MSRAEKKKSENNFRCALIYKKNIERKTFIGFQLQLNIVSVSHRLLVLHGNIYPTSTGDMILFSCSPLYDRDNFHILQSSTSKHKTKTISFHFTLVLFRNRKLLEFFYENIYSIHACESFWCLYIPRGDFHWITFAAALRRITIGVDWKLSRRKWI